MGIKATDKNRNLFLKGFKLSNSGGNEDPTYLGFKIIFDFGNLPINTNYGWAPSPILRSRNYTATDGGSIASMLNPFGQPQYVASNTDVTYYSAYNYLLQRDGAFEADNNKKKRANALLQFQKLLREINTNSPWFFQSIEGLDKLDKVSKSGFQTTNELDYFDNQRTGDKFLTIQTLESLNLRMNALQDLYNQATFDADNMRWLVPRNLRKFTMWIFVTEIRNFFKTSRLAGASTTLSAINDFSSLISTDRNPGSAIIENDLGSGNSGSTTNGDSQSAFSSFANDVFNKSGLNNERDALSNQADQSGIKPVLIYECSQCEFDFSESTSVKTIVDLGAEAATPEENSFKIHVGKVRIKNQYPNIRGDKKPLILADGYTQSQSSVEDLDVTLDVEGIASMGRELLTNFVSGAVSDLINEGISQFVSPALSGLDQSVMGNIYSMDPSQLASATNGKGLFNNAANYLNGASETGIDNIFKGNLPNPQTMGEGGPPERVYQKISSGNTDVYPDVPGRDLGVKERVYIKPNDDVYDNVPGSDLGVPDRVYPEVNDDVYKDVPGSDLGVPERVYPGVNDDVYDNVPGSDLGVPDRIYPEPQGDVYSNVPGSDLGVPDRIYPETTGDVYLDVPGSDLGVPERVYNGPNDDVYDNVPGSDLGVPDRVYPEVNDDVYKDVILSDKLENETIYKDDISNTKLEKETIYKDDAPDNKLEKETIYDTEKIITKPSLDKVYIKPPSNETTNIDTVYPGKKVIESRGELRAPESNFESKPEKIYTIETSGNRTPGLGGIYPETSGDFIVDPPLNLGNLKSSSKYNPSLGTYNPDEYEEQ